MNLIFKSKKWKRNRENQIKTSLYYRNWEPWPLLQPGISLKLPQQQRLRFLWFNWRTNLQLRTNTHKQASIVSSRLPKTVMSVVLLSSTTVCEHYHFSFRFVQNRSASLGNNLSTESSCNSLFANWLTIGKTEREENVNRRWLH